MDGSYPDWTSLPAEILLKILHFAIIDEHLPDSNNAQCVSSQVALVCKEWRNPAQSFLFSQVNINSISQLEKFHDVVRCNTCIGDNVKVLEIQKCNIAESDEEVLLAIVTNLLSSCLPNLVSLFQDMYPSYVPILNALLDSKLKHLKSIQAPSCQTNGDELVHYVSCVFLMKERIQQVYITNDFSSFLDKTTNELAITKFEHLYDNLNQFNNLTKIEIIRQTDDGVKVLEHIVKTCRSLREINLTLSSLNNQQDHAQLIDNNDFDTSHYIPRYNIKILTICLSMTPIDNCKFLLYIMKKFPNLEKLDLTRNGKNVQVTPSVLTQLLNYSAAIKEGNFSNLTVSPDGFFTTIGNFWNTTSKPGMENVKFDYSNDQDDDLTIERQFTFHIDKDPINGSQIVLYRSFRVLDRPAHMDFIEKNGDFIGDLTFESATYLENPRGNFWNHIFMYCPNLRNLTFDNVYLPEYEHSELDIINRHSLDKLTLIHCQIMPYYIPEQLSTVLSEVQQLRLIGTYSLDENGYIAGINTMNMCKTKIKTIILGSLINDCTTYIKLIPATDLKYYYYQSDRNIDPNIAQSKSRTKLGKQIDEKVYDNVKTTNCNRFHIGCQTKPEIMIEYYKIERQGALGTPTTIIPNFAAMSERHPLWPE